MRIRRPYDNSRRSLSHPKARREDLHSRETKDKEPPARSHHNLSHSTDNRFAVVVCLAEHFKPQK